MSFCKYCATARQFVQTDDGYKVCIVCGLIVDDGSNLSSQPTFVKGAGGQSTVAGSFVKSIESGSESRARTLENARSLIRALVDNFDMEGGDAIVEQAIRFYTIALDRNFTKGRRTSLVTAACLYIVCRENKKAYLLIDFSEELRINVYVLGAVFLQLCELFRLQEHPIVQKPVDPSLFIHRFTERLLSKYNSAYKSFSKDISKTALRIVANMKRDWMQTGRKPSGLCGAALYISALSHGVKCSKSVIGSVVHICEATLTKRLIEFENTESGSLTIEELNAKAEELETEAKKLPVMGSKSSGIAELLCEHKGSAEASHFCHGLCIHCYKEFIEISGGIQGGSEPPAFQEAERKRIAKLTADKNAKASNLLDDEMDPYSMPKEDVIENENVESQRENDIDIVDKQETEVADISHVSDRHDGTDGPASDEQENFADIDDTEVSGYLHNEDETRLKKIIWEEMNKEYLEEQRIKQEIEALKQAQNSSGNLLEQEFVATTKAAVANSRKEKRQKRAEEAKNAAPAQNPAEAARQMLNRKRVSSKIDYDALDNLFRDNVSPSNAKKNRVESDYNDVEGQQPVEDEFVQEYQNGETYDEDTYHANDEDEDGYNYEAVYGSEY